MRIPARFGRAALSTCARRTFSSTAARPSAIPEYVQSSSEELDTQLQLARDRLIIPRHLTPYEKRLVFGTKHRKLFENEEEPVMAHIGGTDVRLQPLDNKEELSEWKVLKSVVTLAKTPSDWTNVERLLESYQKAGIKLSPVQVTIIVRKAWFQGHHDAVLRMLERAHETGVRINSEQLLATLLWGLREVAVAGRWSRRSIERALRGVRQVADILEAPEHAGGDRAVKTGDLRSLPLTIAAPLELQAVQQVRYPPKDLAEYEKALQDIREGAERLLNNIKIYGTAVVDLLFESKFPDPTGAPKQRYMRLKLAEMRLLRAVPVRHALALSQRLLAPSEQMPQPDVAAKAIDDCDAMISESMDRVSDNLAAGQSIEENWAVRGWRACEWVDEGVKKKKKPENKPKDTVVEPKRTWQRPEEEKGEETEEKAQV